MSSFDNKREVAEGFNTIDFPFSLQESHWKPQLGHTADVLMWDRIHCGEEVCFLSLLSCQQKIYHDSKEYDRYLFMMLEQGGLFFSCHSRHVAVPFNLPCYAAINLPHHHPNANKERRGLGKSLF